MADYAALRTKMVDGQVRTSDVTDLRIIEAMLDIPRESFVPAARRQLAYVDVDLSVGEAENSRVLIKPMVLAKLIQSVAIKPTDKVLEVGSATGYGAAVLSRLAAGVVALEEDATLASSATRALSGYANVTVANGPLVDGAAAFGPFDAIVFNGAVEYLPEAIGAQLKDGGRLAVVEGHGFSAEARLYRKSGASLTGQFLFNAALPLLPGFGKVEAFAF